MAYEDILYDVASDGVCTITINRPERMNALRPQTTRELRDAFAAAKADNFTGTDEASLVERLERVDVIVVQGSDRNIKITRPSDMELARLFHAEEIARRNAS